jgi:hypothetical protein
LGNNRLLVLLGISFLVFIHQVEAQIKTLDFDNLPMYFYSQSKEAFCILEDSLLYACNKKGTWTVETVSFDSQLQKETISEEYLLVSNEEKDYLISKGCGEVYDFIDHKFIRIDHSFAHRNQYSSAVFFHNNQPYFFGGYGLFTTKNILTYYDFQKGEWFLTFTKNKSKPSPRAGVYYQKIKNKLFIIGGEDSENNIGIYQNDVWMYNFNQCCWINLGTINPELKQFFQGVNFNCSHPTSFLVFGPHLLELRADRNRVYEYINDSYSRIIDVIGDGKGNFLVARRKLNGKIQFQQVTKKNFLGKLNKEYVLYTSEKREYLNYLIIFILVASVFGLFFFIKRLMKKVKVHAVAFSDLEIKMCDILLSNGEEGVELSSLNNLLDDGQSNFEALKKRREIKMRELRNKLSEHSNLPLNEVIMEKKSDKDKRIKLFYLNPKIKL